MEQVYAFRFITSIMLINFVYIVITFLKKPYHFGVHLYATLQYCLLTCRSIYGSTLLCFLFIYTPCRSFIFGYESPSLGVFPNPTHTVASISTMLRVFNTQ